MLADSAALSDVFAQPVWLAEHLDDPDVRTVEVDVSRAAYEQGHIPGPFSGTPTPTSTMRRITVH